MTGLVVEPSRAKAEVVVPTVAWDNGVPHGLEAWQGTLTEDVAVPQVELRRTLDNGAHVVVRVNLGNVSTGGKGAKTAAGIVISSNKAIALGFDEYYSLLAAVDEAIAKLTETQQDIYTRLGEKLSGSERQDWGHKLEGDEAVGNVPF